jgi:hypothetical protein
MPRHIKHRAEWKGARWTEKTSRWQVFLESDVSLVASYMKPKFLSRPLVAILTQNPLRYLVLRHFKVLLSTLLNGTKTTI